MVYSAHDDLMACGARIPARIGLVLLGTAGKPSFLACTIRSRLLALEAPCLWSATALEASKT